MSSMRVSVLLLLLSVSVVSPQDLVELGSPDVELSTPANAQQRELDAAYNPTADEFLVVYVRNEVDFPLTPVNEIRGQRVDAATGLPVGIQDFRISRSGPPGDPAFQAWQPAVTYNADADEYLVVWIVIHPPGVNSGEVRGQRLDGSTCSQVGYDDFRISNTIFTWQSVDVAYNAADRQYLVAWSGSEVASGLDNEIHCQRLDGASGAEVGADDFPISDIGPPGALDYYARNPSVVYNPDAGEYLVVFDGTTTPDPYFPDMDVFSQRLHAATGAEVGPDDFRISSTPSGMFTYLSDYPKVAYSRAAGRYLVAWSLETSVSNIHGQFLDGATGAEQGVDDFPISFMGSPINPLGAVLPDLAANDTDGTFLAVWQSHVSLGSSEVEIFGQLIDAASGALVGPTGKQISQTGDDVCGQCIAKWAAVAHREGTGIDHVAFVRKSPPLFPLVAGQRLLTCPTAAAATEVERLGMPPNPSALLPGLTGGPVVGNHWHPAVDHTVLLPAAVLVFAGVSPVAINVPTPIGTLLCDPSGASIQTGLPGGRFDFELPAVSSLVGMTMCAQGGALDAAGAAALTNALDLTLGTF